MEEIEKRLIDLGCRIAVVRDLLEILTDCLEGYGNTTKIAHQSLLSVIEDNVKNLYEEYKIISTKLNL